MSASAIASPGTWIAKLVGPGFDEVAALHSVLRSHGPGVMVDVGAHHGQSLRPFAEDGWHVHAFEPDPDNRAVLVQRIGSMANVTVDGRAIASRDAETVTLYTSQISSGISTLTAFHSSNRPGAQVETVRLDTYLAAADEVTVLKTDAEGYDFPILQTFPWDRLHPRGVVCEFEDRRSAAHGYDYRDMAEFLVRHGYAVLVSEWYPVVEYGQQHRWRTIRRYPVELSDARAWGNLIGVDPPVVTDVLAQAAKVNRLRSRARRLVGALRR